MYIPLDTLGIIIPFCDDVRNIYHMRKCGQEKDKIVDILRNANLNWEKISYYDPLSEDFIREFADLLNWELVTMYQKLSESFMREMKDKIDWFSVPERQVISEDFIREFKDRLRMDQISTFKQDLTEDFIREFADEVEWKDIYECQTLSNEFIMEFAEYMLFWDGECDLFKRDESYLSDCDSPE